MRTLPPPDDYIGLGYALLLKALMQSLPCAACGHRRDVGVTLWQASVAFNTAEMLAEGIDPWAPLGPGEKSWASPEGRAAMRTKKLTSTA